MKTLSTAGQDSTHAAPQVLVVARYRSATDAARIAGCLSRQTYREIQLLFVSPDKSAESPADGAAPNCAAPDFAAHLAESTASHILFWPEDGDLKPAAIENSSSPCKSVPTRTASPMPLTAAPAFGSRAAVMRWKP